MLWIFKILFFTGFFAPNQLPVDLYTYHYQICHFTSLEDFTYQLELKDNNVFYFTRKVLYTSPEPRSYTDFVTGTYTISNTTLVLNPSTTTNKFVKENESISYLLKDNKLTITNNFILTILPSQFEKSDPPIFFR